MQQTIQGNKTLEDKLWEIAAPRMAENILNKTNKYNELSHKELKKWIDKGEVIHARKITNYECSNQLAIVLTGRVILGDNTELHQEQMVRNDTLTLGRKTKVYILPQKL
jgi:hypothetical protein